MAVQLNWNLFFIAFSSCLSHILSVWPCLFPRCAGLFRIFHSPSLHRIFNHSLFALAYVQKKFYSIRRFLHLPYLSTRWNSTLRWLFATKRLSSGGSPGIRGFLTTCEPVAFCLHLCFLTLSQYPMCTKFEIVYPRDLPVSEWVDSKTRAHLIRIIRWKTHWCLNIFNLTFVRLEIASLRDHSDSGWGDWKAGLI